jgi:hypothetical protein
MLKKALLVILIPLFFANTGIIYSQNQRMDGYKGIWYSSGPELGYGYKFSGGVSTFGSRHRPIAIYSPEAKKTFFVYGGTRSAEERHLLIMISYFDHKTKAVPKPVIVYDKMGVKEPYDNASLAIDSKGYLWVFVSGNSRTRPGLIFKSNNPYSIDKFELINEMEMINPQPWYINNHGFILMYSKLARDLNIFCYSSTDGKTWTDGQCLTSMGGNLQISKALGDKIVTVFTYFPGGNIDMQTNLYLLQSPDLGKTWKNIEGKEVTLPVSGVKNEALIKDFESEGRLVFLSDIDFDSNGNPVILVILSKSWLPGPEGGQREWFVVRWKENKWEFNKVCESTHNFDRGALHIEGTEWKIIGPTEPGPQKYGTGGEIALWESSNDGADWHKLKNVTENSINNNSFVQHPVNAHKDFFALWADGDADEFSKSYLYFTNEACDKVWVLPYDMKDDFQKPVRIR